MKPTQQGDVERELDAWHMERALELAARGRGAVEPNPLVGAVVAHGAEIVGEGYHRRYGGPHAEVEALQMAGDRARGATLYVTLEPCCHFGKTPPCTQAVVAAGVRRVVAAMSDPFPQVAGRGANELRAAGIAVEIGLHEERARALNAPYLKLLSAGKPWVIAKWAQTLDGKIATRTGDSMWISNEASRAVVHELRGRVDAILVGAGTARSDDPLLTVRPAEAHRQGPRTPVRIVVDDRAELALESKLVRTACDVPVLVAVAVDAPRERIDSLAAAGVEIVSLRSATRSARLAELLDELGRRRMTNLLVEGGARLLGTLFDAQLVDEVHTFIAPKILGDRDAISPIAGAGLAKMADALLLDGVRWQFLEGDAYFSGRVRRKK